MARKPLLDPAVAEVSPNFYNAALQSQLSTSEQTLINQGSLAWSTANKLMKLGKEKARKQFLELTPDVQATIRYMYPDREEFMPEQNPLQSAFQKVAGVVGGAIKFAGSPIISAFQAAETYGRVINTPYQLEQKREQGENVLSLRVLTDTYYGKNNWRWDRVEEYNKKYGVALTTLARGIAEGRTPGESIDLYGKFDKDMYAAIQFMNDNPKRFDTFMKSVKMDAQVSWGRDILNKFVPTEAAADGATLNSNHWAVKFTKKLGIDVTTQKGRLKAKSLVSGPLDGIYQTAIDPLSYVGITPAVKAATTGIRGVQMTGVEAKTLVGLKPKGERLADIYQVIAERNGNASDAIGWAFSQPDVIKLWDDELGPLIKNYAEADGATNKAAAYNEIVQNFPDWANREVVKELARPEVKAFDAAGAENFFTNIDNFNKLLTSRVDGTTYKRNGIPSASFSRKIAATVEKTARAVFSPTITAKSDPAILAKVDDERQTAMDILKTTADSDDVLLNPNVGEIFKLGKDVSKVQRGLQKIGTAFARSPGRILFGDDAVKTSQDFRNLAYLVLENPRIADAMTESFLDETMENQFTIVRNLYQAVMLKAGMNGSAGGEAHMATILASTFSEQGLGTTSRIEVPLDFADVLNPSAFRMENDVPLLTGKGAIRPSQLVDGIAPLPYDLIYQYGAQSKVSQKINFTNALGGATRNNAVRLYTDFWANQTLFPRLGIRSAIDEAFFMYMAVPWYNVRQYLTGAAVAPTRVLEAITGSNSAMGMYRRAAYKLPFVGKLLDPRKKITPDQRYQGVKNLAKIESERRGYDVPESEIAMSLIREDVVRQAEEIYGDTLDPETWENIRELIKVNPQVLDSMVNSLGARSSLSGKMDVDYVDTMFTPSNLSKMYEDYGLTATKKFRPIQVSKMDQKQVAIAHYRQYSLSFPYNSKSFGEGVFISPATAFFTNNGLETAQDLVKARNQLLEKVGVKFSDEVGGYVVTNEKAVKAFNTKFSSTVYSRQQGLPESEIAWLHVDRMLTEMRYTFHGGPNAFNKKLLDAVNAKHKEIVDYRLNAKKSLEGAWENAAASLTFKEFEDVTVNMHPVGEINTDLVSYGEVKDMKVFEEEGGLPMLLQKFGNWSMEVMDATVTGFYRQKALWIAYSVNRKKIKPLENMLATRYKNALIEQGMNPGKAAEIGKTHAAKQVVEQAWKQSGEEVLQYVDNPNIRSNMAISVRSVARFYRATEDFYRRLYRVYGKTPLRTLYRLRLLNTGLDAAGDIYEDDKGDKYIIFPTDTIINSAVEPVVRAFTGNEDFNIPTFNELSLKLRLINPSFAPDAGYPALSGPIGAFSTLVLKSIVGNVVPFLDRLGLVSEGVAESLQPKALEATDVIGKIGLGNFADTTNFKNFFVPMLQSTFLQAASTLDTGKPSFSNDEWDRQQTTAIQQAVRYFQAFGLGIDESATEAEKYTFQKNLKIATSNIIIARTLLGYISPGMPTFRETKELPDFLKKVGITGFKAEFWDIYNGILRNQGEDVGNVYDLAVATYVGKNPGKLIYTVPTTEKEWKVIVAMTNEVKDFVRKNERFIDTYKEMGYIYAPKTGEFNADVYNFLEAEGLIKLPTFEDYLVKLQVAVDKEKYFEVQKQLEERLATTGITQERKELINIAAKTKKDMTTANPYLQAEVNGSINEQGALKVKFKALAEANQDKRNPADAKTKKAMQIALEEVANFVANATDEYNSRRYDFSNLKEQQRIEVQNIINELAKVYPAVNEANRVVFKPLLNSFSRDAVQAGSGR
jgi:Tfp pilus assembly major pilin PilA